MIIEKLQQKHTEQVIALQQTLVPFTLCPEKAVILYETMQNSEDFYVAVAREGDEIIGTATGICCHGLGGNFLVIEDFVVRENLRGKGIGTQLMARLDAFAVQRNCIYAILVSSGFRKNAHRFYEKCGFHDDVRGFRKNY